ANQTMPFAQRSTRQMQHALQIELVGRYLSHERTDNATVQQFAADAGLWYTADNHKQESTEETDTVAQPYILSIGDIVTDAFIKLRDDQARIDTGPDGSKRLSMDFGSKPPYDHVDIVQAVGNSANAAVAFTRLGVNAGLMAWLGDDKPGEESLAYLQSENVDTTPISVAENMKSNYHYALRYGADRTILIKYEDYDYAWQTPNTVPDWLYLSMISESSWQLHLDMLDYLNEHTDTKLVFQPGTFHFQWGVEKLAAVYARTYLVVMNREEAALVTGKTTESIPDLMQAMHQLGPQIVVITDGPNGAYASDGERTLMMPNYPDPAAPYDRTGAGDAFASTIVAALALGETLETALTWAPINSMSVVQQLGAQAGLLHRSEFDQYLHDAPSEYHPKDLD
ncbi:MAG: carbohydrate kinase family protein, partial [Candidatus Saccharimonadales bacterium]